MSTPHTPRRPGRAATAGANIAALLVALVAITPPAPAAAEIPAAESPAPIHSPEPKPAPDLSREAEELTEAAREAIEQFAAMMGPMLDGLEQMIEDMPRYEAPEVLPNGDILIRRVPQAPDAPPGLDPDADVTDL